MRRDVLWSVAFAFGVGALSVPLAASAALIAQEARKVCLERYIAEKNGGTLPGGMTKARYLSQCANSIKRIAALERAQAASTQGASKPAGR